MLGFNGHQPECADGYTSTGSLYMATLSFLPLGLPADDPFWTDAYADWTSKKLGKEDIYTKITKWNTKTGLSNGPETNLYNLARHENLYINNKNVVIK